MFRVSDAGAPFRGCGFAALGVWDFGHVSDVGAQGAQVLIVFVLVICMLTALIFCEFVGMPGFCLF